jgi:hypothetical protein
VIIGRARGESEIGIRSDKGLGEGFGCWLLRLSVLSLDTHLVYLIVVCQTCAFHIVAISVNLSMLLSNPVPTSAEGWVDTYPAFPEGTLNITILRLPNEYQMPASLCTVCYLTDGTLSYHLLKRQALAQKAFCHHKLPGCGDLCCHWRPVDPFPHHHHDPPTDNSPANHQPTPCPRITFPSFQICLRNCGA